jgi:hypothetical protein
VQASSYQCATTDSIEEALNGDSDVLFYTGGGDENHLIVEAPNGLSARFEKDDVHQLFSGGTAIGPVQVEPFDVTQIVLIL